MQRTIGRLDVVLNTFQRAALFTLECRSRAPLQFSLCDVNDALDEALGLHCDAGGRPNVTEARALGGRLRDLDL